jgi:hypothetical protein
MTNVPLLDFDEIDVWFPQLTKVLTPLLPPDVGDRLQRANPEFVEDARDLVFVLGDRDRVIDAAIDWIRSSRLIAYHGTRLTDDDVKSVTACGLISLTVKDRRARIVRALSSHPAWNTAADRLDEVLRNHGPGSVAGVRAGQVHLTLSRSGITQGFNHYLTHGAEVDQHIAHALLGEEGQECLRTDGKSRLILVKLSGDIALQAAHPWFDIEETRARQTTRSGCLGSYASTHLIIAAASIKRSLWSAGKRKALVKQLAEVCWANERSIHRAADRRGKPANHARATY